jgi:hypothetical protein
MLHLRDKLTETLRLLPAILPSSHQRRLTLLKVGCMTDALVLVLYPIGTFIVPSLATLATATSEREVKHG